MSKAPYAATLTTLKRLAKNKDGREGFLKSLKGRFRYLGRGAFRKCYAACDGWVFKVKVTSEDCDYGGSYDEHETALEYSNYDESTFYDTLKRDYKYLAKFVTPIHFFNLHGDEDVVFAPRVRCLYDRPGKTDDDEFWSDVAKAQDNLIRDTFEDSHNGNVGYKGNLRSDAAKLWLIDANLNRPWQADESYEQEELKYRLKGGNRQARTVLKMMSRVS